MPTLTLVPITFKEANEYVKKYHRHHGSVVGHKFSIAVAVENIIVGVAIVGRPVSRGLDNGWTLEVLRVCTNGTKNACSFLYAAAWRATKALGYKKLVTYILNTESGKSIVAAGWKCLGECGGGNWNCKSRPRIDTDPLQKKLRFEIV